MQRQDDASDICKAAYIGQELHLSSAYIRHLHDYIRRINPQQAWGNDRSATIENTITDTLNSTWNHLQEITHTLKRMQRVSVTDLTPQLLPDIDTEKAVYEAAAKRLPILLDDQGPTGIISLRGPYNPYERFNRIHELCAQAADPSHKWP